MPISLERKMQNEKRSEDQILRSYNITGHIEQDEFAKSIKSSKQAEARNCFENTECWEQFK